MRELSVLVAIMFCGWCAASIVRCILYPATACTPGEYVLAHPDAYRHQ